jgi:hypothetical protein
MRWKTSWAGAVHTLVGQVVGMGLEMEAFHVLLLLLKEEVGLGVGFYHLLLLLLLMFLLQLLLALIQSRVLLMVVVVMVLLLVQPLYPTDPALVRVDLRHVGGWQQPAAGIWLPHLHPQPPPHVQDAGAALRCFLQLPQLCLHSMQLTSTQSQLTRLLLLRELLPFLLLWVRLLVRMMMRGWLQQLQWAARGRQMCQLQCCNARSQRVTALHHWEAPWSRQHQQQQASALRLKCMAWA